MRRSKALRDALGAVGQLLLLLSVLFLLLLGGLVVGVLVGFRGTCKAPPADRVNLPIEFRVVDVISDGGSCGGGAAFRLIRVRHQTLDDKSGAQAAVHALASGRWRVSNVDCSGETGCDPSVPDGFVLVDDDDAYAKVCFERASEECDSLIELAGERALDPLSAGEFLISLEYPNAGQGRWSR